MHWAKDPANKAKLARVAAKRARTRKKRGRAIAKSGDAVRYGAKSNVLDVIRGELRDAEKRVVALKGILKRYGKALRYCRFVALDSEGIGL